MRYTILYLFYTEDIYCMILELLHAVNDIMSYILIKVISIFVMYSTSILHNCRSLEHIVQQKWNFFQQILWLLFWNIDFIHFYNCKTCTEHYIVMLITRVCATSIAIYNSAVMNSTVIVKYCTCCGQKSFQIMLYCIWKPYQCWLVP